MFQTSQDTDASAPASVSRTRNHSSGVYRGGAPPSRSMRPKSLSRIACSIVGDPPILLGQAQLADERVQTLCRRDDLTHALPPICCALTMDGSGTREPVAYELPRETKLLGGVRFYDTRRSKVETEPFDSPGSVTPLKRAATAARRPGAAHIVIATWAPRREAPPALPKAATRAG